MAKSREAKNSEGPGMETNKAKTSARDAKSGSGGRGNMSAASGSGGTDMMGQAAEVLGHAQDQATSIVGMASQQATSQLGMQKDRAASTLGAVATALHEASRQMRQQDETAIAGYIDSAAGQVEQLSTMLQEQDINQIINTTAQFARRQPALFLAGAFALGFIGTRFLKSSSPSRGQSFGAAGYGTSGGWDSVRGDASGSMGSGYGMSSGQSGYGYSGAGESGSAMGSSSKGSGRQEGFSGSTGGRSGSDWTSRDSSGLGSEGS